MLFPFSLKDKDKAWLKSEPTCICRSSEELANAFLAKFYPARITSQIRTQLQTFKQQLFESFYEAWEWFKDLLVSFPHHQIPDWLLAQSFYVGLHDDHKYSVNAACNGDMDSKSPEEVLKLFKTMNKNSFSWGNERERTSHRNTIDNEAIRALTKRMAALSE